MTRDRILYLSGPADASNVLAHWTKQEQNSSYFGSDYLRQFLDVCKTLDVKATIISLNHGEDAEAGDIRILYRPVPFEHSRGLLFHFGQVFYLLQFVIRAAAGPYSTVIVTPGRPYWFVLCLLRLTKIRTIASIHCVLWPTHRAPSRSTRMLYGMTRWFFKYGADAVLMHSDAIERQVLELAPASTDSIHRFLPMYSADQFDSIPPPEAPRDKFHVLYLGRIERDKGVYDLCEIADRLREKTSPSFQFHVCGDGSELENLREFVADQALTEQVRVYGHCGFEEIQRLLGLSHVVLVPTRTEFIEGFNKVVVEAVLAGRPVVSSSLCPSISTVPDSVLEVRPDNVSDYANALESLRTDVDLYARLQQATTRYRDRFLDPSRSWGMTLQNLLSPPEKSLP